MAGAQLIRQRHSTKKVLSDSLWRYGIRGCAFNSTWGDGGAPVCVGFSTPNGGVYIDRFGGCPNKEPFTRGKSLAIDAEVVHVSRGLDALPGDCNGSVILMSVEVTW